MKYLHPSLLFTVCALFALTSTAQTKVKPEIIYSTQPQKYVLGGVAIDGIKGYDDDLLLNIAGLEVGSTYEVPGEGISQAIRNYWKQGLFSNVQIDADSLVGDTIYLHIRLTAQPRITSINFTGMKKTEREEIEARIPLRAGNQITPNLVDRTKRRILKYYEEKGYKNAEVNIVQHEDPTDTHKMLVDIDVKKNNKITVHKIFMTGVDPKEARALKNAMKKTSDRSTFKKWITFSSRKFLPEKYEEDKGFIIDKLNSWGYRDALVVTDSVVPIDTKHVDIYLDIRKGKKYYVRNINWVGNTIYPSEGLAATLKMKKGDLYDQTFMMKRLQADEDAVGNQYYNNGYVFSSIKPVEINVEGDSIDLEMRVTEGTQATLNRIRFAGNDRVYDHVIRRELRTKPGDLFSMEAIQRTVRELASMGQFDPEYLTQEIFKNIRPDGQTGTVDITYPLATKGGDQVELSLGWGQTGVLLRAGLKFTNFSLQNILGSRGYKRAGFIPQGDGQTLSLAAQTNGRYYTNFSLSFTDPWFGGKRPNHFSFSAFYSHQSDYSSNYYNNYSNYYSQYYAGYGNNSSYYNAANYYDPDKYMDIIGLNVGFGKRLHWPDDYFQFMVNVGYTRYNMKNWNRNYFLISNGNSNNFNVGLTLSRNSTDNPLFPRSGSDFNFQLTLTPPYSLFDGKNYQGLATNYNSSTYDKEAQEKYRWLEYHKWILRFRTYTALNSSLKHCPVIMTRTDFGIVGAYNKHRKSPFETFYVGGDGMTGYTTYGQETIALRGYENGSIAGNNTGNAYAYTRLGLELRYPLMLEASTNIYALGFVEAGNAWTDVSKMNPFSLRKSAGVGVRLFLNFIGLMGIDWAYGFDKYAPSGQKIGGSHFHFILGQEF